MRVTGGSARGRRLKPPAPPARATSDLVRGAIFDALAARNAGLSRVLDLYAGSGALGIEALSRGAGWCDFVESAAKNAAIIRENIEATGFAGRARVHRVRVERAAGRLEGPYTLVLADPPYADQSALAALESIAGSRLVGPGTVLVLECSSRRDAPERLGTFALDSTRRHGDTQVAVYRPQPP